MKAGKPEPPDNGWDFQRLVDALADPLFVLDGPPGAGIRIVAANAASASFFGVPPQQCIDRLLTEVLPESAALRFITECDRCRASRLPTEFPLEPHANPSRAFLVKLSVIPEGGKAGGIAAVARLTSTLAGLGADPNAEHFRVIAEHAADYISRCDREGRVLYLNPAIERLTGTTFVSLVGKEVSEWDPPPPHLERYRECIRRVAETGKSHTTEMDFRDPSSGQTVYHQIRYTPEWGADGEVLSIIGVGRDITQLKAAEAELRSLNATLEERVAARTQDLQRANGDLRRFAWTVSHDLRAPLRAIRGYMTWLAEDEGERLSDAGRALLDRVGAAATKLDGLINAILAYSQAEQNTLSGERVDMEGLAREVVEELVPQPSSVHIHIADLPAARADVTMVRQIIQNLVGNALKYSSGREHPRIEVGWLEREGQIVYSVRDNGVGFDMQYAHKLYAIFERLHTADEFPGNGVGLAIVKRLVERHGGSIWAESRTEQGATFYFTLGAKT
jgi:PAS domain S-box-containing protein